MAIKNKITDIIFEPTQVFKKDKFKIKIKCTRYLTVEELKPYTVNQFKKFTVKELRGG